MHHWILDLEIEGELVSLVPLSLDHREALLEAAADGKLWELWYTSVPSESTIDKYLETALSQKDKGLEYPFAVIENKTGRVVGCTRYYNLEPSNHRLEIGYTWYAKSAQRTGINTECKLLLLSFAFEELDCIAVQFMTHWHNLRSRRAIERLGARQDGVLRNHRLLADGSVRDTVVYSITNYDWDGVKQNLVFEMNKYQH